MEFQDSWLTVDTEALDLTCTVLIPSITTQTDADGYGIGGAETEPIIERYNLSCMEVPETMIVSYEQGLRVKIPKDLVVNDPLDRVQPQRVIEFNSRRYRITTHVEAVQHTLKRVQIDPIGAV